MADPEITQDGMVGNLDLPMLDRQQIRRKLEQAYQHNKEAGCHIAHCADTYKKSGNEGHYECCVAVLVSIDAVEEFIENLLNVA